MKLIIGLGNPGKKYERNRHNYGFLAVDHIHENFKTFDNWTLDKKSNALISKGEFEGEQIILVKPQTFINLSGSAVATLANFYKIEAQDIWVIHDDFDLPLGVIRINKNSSNGGHKGVKSMIDALGTKNFLRFRLGIHPIGKTFLSVIFKKLTSIEKFVLKNFDKEEIKMAEEVIKRIGQAIETALKEGPEQAMNQFN
ncbi:MAG: aminoacyl-tRNA hydrolase [Parcubacteria group bacterium CG1_02_40_82]|uniref:Peptidyl-tRNA hydrolase n=3 Tax=Candidatus Portnoyibacteriota TaxID=1817913 RepID=A0A2M7IH30_9BACT|nr:MAG: aminoacyl-tRNA hydrolase [Parcubacteria group bacterium CG1_02_40_82]PIQ75376.1 MAG: aminoacyl-tRNA hydrolase [Candidatus Portnoybacteria bacterium CG11_big_fil_rev_8_21_14_0_20_40_15]PIW75837.1 MAG: aminoacyl-tRNA hydrolase [Candidatus Portnoybacteria bacterium CG_4_8_14_3_um_filter_40_10]PJA64869.1 MAG: aminoacyl-tRNA hydrolase [Candidatus Portnoybacteria bacterium CG_4_9_14_3_um_filter_40_10]